MIILSDSLNKKIKAFNLLKCCFRTFTEYKIITVIMIF
jgi:hypothetical protein